MQNSTKCISRDESGKRKHLLRKRLHTSWVSSSAKNKKINKKIDVRQAKVCAGDQASKGGAEGEEGERASMAISGSPE